MVIFLLGTWQSKWHSHETGATCASGAQNGRPVFVGQILGQILMPHRTQNKIFCVESSSSEETPNTPDVSVTAYTFSYSSSYLLSSLTLNFDIGIYDIDKCRGTFDICQCFKFYRPSPNDNFLATKSFKICQICDASPSLETLLPCGKTFIDCHKTTAEFRWVVCTRQLILPVVYGLGAGGLYNGRG